MENEPCWLIETAESLISKPFFLVGRSQGKCFLLWDDNFDEALKFETRELAFDWAKENWLHCGFRVKKYAGSGSKKIVESRSNVAQFRKKKDSPPIAQKSRGVNKRSRSVV